MAARSEGELREWARRFREVIKIVGPLDYGLRKSLEQLALTLEWAAGDDQPEDIAAIWSHVFRLESTWSFMGGINDAAEKHAAGQSLTSPGHKP